MRFLLGGSVNYAPRCKQLGERRCETNRPDRRRAQSGLRHSGSLTKAAFLSARNDAIANVAIIAAGLVTTFLWGSAWPDLIVGIAIGALNIDASRAVFNAARAEYAARQFQTDVLTAELTLADGLPSLGDLTGMESPKTALTG